MGPCFVKVSPEGLGPAGDRNSQSLDSLSNMLHLPLNHQRVLFLLVTNICNVSIKEIGVFGHLHGYIL